ncbi:HAD-IIA family hydrolase [Mycobacterium spongiae]|uniref:HAD-IIA family hydrolase n=1 Tax=Mycobacterium spongiae TaxID=886343 RepID=A0A975PXT7_9MYCO|nr:HAD-IIA family hydrolase [Mycobacterium spongiae]QUR68530.1 HAD-IIA family hydrolase [Mycobacterium spongiae]
MKLGAGATTPSGVLFDIDGVLVLSWRPIPGAAETVQQLASHHIACSYLTNTTTRTRRQIAQALGEAGIAVAADEVITAGALTAEYLRAKYPGRRCFLVNSGDISEDMSGINLVSSTEFGPADRPDTPDVVVLGGAGPEFDHLTLSRVYEWMVDGVPVVAMHRSRMWTTDRGTRIDTGTYLTGLEEASGRMATAVGKPAAEGFLTAASRIGVDAERVVMIGDDLRNDVVAAQAVGMTGVLVRTGKFRQDALDRWVADDAATPPDNIIDSVADLPELLGL